MAWTCTLCLLPTVGTAAAMPRLVLARHRGATRSSRQGRVSVHTVATFRLLMPTGCLKSEILSLQ